MLTRRSILRPLQLHIQFLKVNFCNLVKFTSNPGQQTEDKKFGFWQDLSLYNRFHNSQVISNNCQEMVRLFKITQIKFQQYIGLQNIVLLYTNFTQPYNHKQNYSLFTPKKPKFNPVISKRYPINFMSLEGFWLSMLTQIQECDSHFLVLKGLRNVMVR